MWPKGCWKSLIFIGVILHALCVWLISIHPFQKGVKMILATPQRRLRARVIVLHGLNQTCFTKNESAFKSQWYNSANCVTFSFDIISDEVLNFSGNYNHLFLHWEQTEGVSLCVHVLSAVLTFTSLEILKSVFKRFSGDRAIIFHLAMCDVCDERFVKKKSSSFILIAWCNSFNIVRQFSL